MKTLIVLTLLVASVSAFGQDVDQWVKKGIEVGAASASARAERDKLAKASQAYNKTQPDFPFKGASFEPRIAEDFFGLGSLSRQDQAAVKASLGQLLTGRSSLIAANRAEIGVESDDRDNYEANRHVKKPDYFGQPTVEIGENIIEYSFFTAEKREDVDLWFGHWWRGVDFHFGRETVYVGITAKIISRKTMTSRHTYKVLVSASDADNVGGNLADGFFGASVGGNYSANSRGSLRLRAFETAIRELGKVFKDKDATAS